MKHVYTPAPTPLVPVRLEAFGQTVWCKLEYLQPSGSTKDRIARYILEKAHRRGEIGAGSRVAEASSGSTSIALALVCAQMGMHFTAVMPEGVSQERLWILEAYGAAIELTDRSAGIEGAIRRVQALVAETGAYWPRQFSNPDNTCAHRHQTSLEILQQLPGKSVDIFASGVGTGGTLVGVTQGLCDAGCRVVPVLARPVETNRTIDAECCSFSPKIPGVVDGLSTIFSEANLPRLVEQNIPDAEALEVTRMLIRAGHPVGPSSGLNYLAAIRALETQPAGAVAVTVFPDRMERYFSTELFQKRSS